MHGSPSSGFSTQAVCSSPKARWCGSSSAPRRAEDEGSEAEAWATFAGCVDAETTLAGLDTAAASLLDTETFVATATYDALGRPVTQTTHDASITRYAYNHDPVGNMVEIQDDATQTEYFANAVVEPHQQFTYDALYRLASAVLRATGDKTP